MKSMNRDKTLVQAAEGKVELGDKVKVPVDQEAPPVDSAESALKRIRKLASKIDASVEY